MRSLSVIVLSGICKNAKILGLGLSGQSDALRSVLAQVVLGITTKGLTGSKNIQECIYLTN